MKDQDLALIISELLRQMDRQSEAITTIRTDVSGLTGAVTSLSDAVANLNSVVQRMQGNFQHLEETNQAQNSIIRILADRIMALKDIDERLDKLEAVVFNKGFVE